MLTVLLYQQPAVESEYHKCIIWPTAVRDSIDCFTLKSIVAYSYPKGPYQLLGCKSMLKIFIFLLLDSFQCSHVVKFFIMLCIQCAMTNRHTNVLAYVLPKFRSTRISKEICFSVYAQSKFIPFCQVLPYWGRAICLMVRQMYT